MPYMNKKTFDIYLEVYDIIAPYDYFFVDDLIALPIQTLNRKGYITNYCCAGHPFEQEFQDIIVPYSDPVEYKREHYKINCHSYIVFSEGIISLMEVPHGFDKEISISGNLVIRKNYDYDGTDVYGIMSEILETMKQLYKWSLSLPNLKD